MSKLKKLSLMLSALAVSGALAGPANALTSAQVSQIRGLVDSGDEAALRAFLLQNLSVLDNSPLSVALRDFISSPPEQTVFTALGFRNTIPDDLQDLVVRAKTDPSLY